MLGAFGQGELALYTNFMMLSALLLGFGLPAGMVHFIASGKIEKEKIVSLLVTVMIIGLITFLMILFIFHQSGILFNILPSVIYSSTVWFWIMILHLVLVLFNIFLSSIIQAEAHFGKSGGIAVTGSLIQLTMYAIYYFSSRKSAFTAINWIIVSLLMSQFIQMILNVTQLYKIDKNYFRIGKVELTLVKPLLQFAGLAFATNLIQFLSYKMDLWFVNYFHGKELTGIYSLGVMLAQMLWLLPSALQSVLYAFISTHKDHKLNIQKTSKSTRQLGLYALIAGVAGYILSCWLVPVLFGIEFTSSVQVIGILLLGIMPFCLSMPVSGYFAATGRIQINLHSAIIGFVCCLCADVLLIPHYGIYGAAVASAISYISTVSYLLIRYRIELKS